MSFLTHLLGSTLQNTRPLTNITSTNIVCVRNASKKASSSTRIKPGHPRPKHRGWKVQDGWFVQKGHILATQLRPRFHPGLYVGMGRNGTLYALEAGRVIITSEKINPNTTHTWATMNYAGRENSVIYKKHFNVIPEKQHNRFILIDTV
ncbi:PREDICTED: 39S ribosomal protein L27, mitochondrial [Dufourea novaeangliae]|uniref:Large ribosomal subunit protein bL27m n=1 Tax=Dufourea novaeangliae TaxID=178035 RepID=A0A154PDH4_DUFNO|nr:PREDICTED: 39S ribosomal protein L27, mitochondrial [Dufourea novaeangliae]KZC09902.1 39S ribosomal protein L27, mitochondrial [Dufourea novaeangliae]